MRPAGVASRQLRARRRVLAIRNRAVRARRARLLPGSRAISRSASAKPLTVAVGERRGEGALEQIDVVRIGAQGLTKIERRPGRVAVVAGDQRGEIIAGLGLPDLEGSRAGSVTRARQERRGEARARSRRAGRRDSDVGFRQGKSCGARAGVSFSRAERPIGILQENRRGENWRDEGGREKPSGEDGGIQGEGARERGRFLALARARLKFRSVIRALTLSNPGVCRWASTQARNTAFMRVRRPLPCIFHQSTMSLSRLRCTEILPRGVTTRACFQNSSPSDSASGASARV